MRSWNCRFLQCPLGTGVQMSTKVFADESRHSVHLPCLWQQSAWQKKHSNNCKDISHGRRWGKEECLTNVVSSPDEPKLSAPGIFLFLFWIEVFCLLFNIYFWLWWPALFALYGAICIYLVPPSPTSSIGSRWLIFIYILGRCHNLYVNFAWLNEITGAILQWVSQRMLRPNWGASLWFALTSVTSWIDAHRMAADAQSIKTGHLVLDQLLWMGEAEAQPRSVWLPLCWSQSRCRDVDSALLSASHHNHQVPQCYLQSVSL